MPRVVSDGELLLGVVGLRSVVSGVREGLMLAVDVRMTMSYVVARAICCWCDGCLMFRQMVGELLVTRLSHVATDNVPILQELHKEARSVPAHGRATRLALCTKKPLLLHVYWLLLRLVCREKV